MEERRKFRSPGRDRTGPRAHLQQDRDKIGTYQLTESYSGPFPASLDGVHTSTLLQWLYAQHVCNQRSITGADNQQRRLPYRTYLDV